MSDATLSSQPSYSALSRPMLNFQAVFQVSIRFFILFICLAPFLLVIVVSFGQKIEGAGWVWAFDLSNYRRFFVGLEWPEAFSALSWQRLYHTLLFAVLASIIAVALAFPFTYFMVQLSRKAQAAWLVVLLACLSFSEVFVVMGWDILLSARSGLPALLKEVGITAWLKETGWLTVLREWDLANPRNVKFKTSIVATVLTMAYLVWPYAVILLYPSLSRIDRSMIEAARTMGAGSFTIAWTIVLPTIRLPLIGVMLLLFVFLLGIFVTVTYFAAPANQTLPVSIYSSIRGATLNAPFGAAQAVVLLLTASVLIIAGASLAKRAGGRP